MIIQFSINSSLFELGGYYLISISDKNGLIWEELSQNSDTFQPLFLLPTKESDENVTKMAMKLDKDCSECETFDMDFDGQNISLNCEFEFVADGKLLTLCSGCGKRFHFHYLIHLSICMIFKVEPIVLVVT